MQDIKKFTNCNTDSAFIKIVALVFMIIDHMGATIYPEINELRVLGRISFPLFAWGMVLGASYTKNIWIYILRVLIMAFVSQPIYNYVLGHYWNNLNILFTLSLALLGIAGMQTKNYVTRLLIPLVALALTSYINVDYGTAGVLFVMLLYLAKESKASVLAFFITFTMYWGISSFSMQSLFGININYGNRFVQMISPWLSMQGLAILALPFILINTNSGIKINKWISYSLYPAHLFLIALLQYILK